MRGLIIVVMAFGLAACEEVVSEREGTIEFQGDTYRTVTRAYARNGTTYERRTVFARPRPVTCSAVDDRDCEAAMKSEWLDIR